MTYTENKNLTHFLKTECTLLLQKFTEIYDLGKEATAPAVIKQLTQPVEVVSDCSPQFNCKAFTKFNDNWNFTHTVSSPTHAQSNGESQRCGKEYKKKAPKKVWRYERPILERHVGNSNTPLLSGKSPAELMLGRKRPDSLPRYPSPDSRHISSGDASILSLVTHSMPSAEGARRTLFRGVRGYTPRKILNFRLSETSFAAI